MAEGLALLEPHRELNRMRRQMDNLWDSIFETRPTGFETWGGEWLPSLDLSETKDEFVVKAEIPGIEAKDIDISLSGGTLTIKGEKKQEKEEKDENYHCVERNYGSFSRSVRLPGQVQGNKVKASYKDGVLRVALPKSEESRTKEIKIEVK